MSLKQRCGLDDDPCFLNDCCPLWALELYLAAELFPASRQLEVWHGVLIGVGLVCVPRHLCFCLRGVSKLFVSDPCLQGVWYVFMLEKHKWLVFLTFFFGGWWAVQHDPASPVFDAVFLHVCCVINWYLSLACSNNNRNVDLLTDPQSTLLNSRALLVS